MMRRARGILLSLLAALLLMAPCILRAQGGKGPSPAGAPVTIGFGTVDIREFLARMSVLLGKNIIFDERVSGMISIFPARPVPLEQAFSFMKSVLEHRGYAVIDCGAFLKVMPIHDAVRKHDAIIIDMPR